MNNVTEIDPALTEATTENSETASQTEAVTDISSETETTTAASEETSAEISSTSEVVSETESVTEAPKVSEITETVTEIGEITETGTEISVETVENSLSQGFFLGVGAVLAVLIIAAAAILIYKKVTAPKPVMNKQSEEKVVTSKPAPPPPDLKIYNIQNIGRRSSQQDSFGTSNINDKSKGILSIVADGMGGIANGAEMSKLTVSVMLSEFEKTPVIPNPQEFLLESVRKAQNACRAKIAPGTMSGTTVVAVFIKNDDLYYISVGDSRINFFRDGELVKLNRDHTLGAELDEKAARGAISIEEAKAAKNRGSLTSYIGTGDELLVDRNLTPIKLKTEDIILLMSDGVFGSATNEEIKNALRTGNLKTAGDMLMNAVLAKNKQHQDNFTAILLKY
jgi:protein phosphatase